MQLSYIIITSRNHSIRTVFSSIYFEQKCNNNYPKMTPACVQFKNEKMQYCTHVR